MDVTDGLVNSAAGIVTGFLPPPNLIYDEHYCPKFILVKFDDINVGHKRRTELRNILKNYDKDCTNIPQIEVPFTIGKSSKITSKRIQFPLTHAWAVTIHKEQGKTEDTLVLSVKGSFHPGQFYTAISRTKTMEGLFLTDNIQASKVKVNGNSLKEIQRMKQNALLSPPVPVSLQKSSYAYLKINFLNINSLKPHASSLMKDHFIQECHLTALVETWLLPTDDHAHINNYHTLRCDHSSRQKQQTTNRRSGGLLLYCHQDLYLIKEYIFKNLYTEYQMAVFSHPDDPTVRFVFVSVYNNPNNTVQHFLCSMEKLLCTIPINLKSIIVGDFNIDILKQTKGSEQLQKLFKYYGFIQLCSTPTHKRGGLLDHCYTNIHSEDIILSVIPVYYSDHFLLSTSIPLQCLN